MCGAGLTVTTASKNHAGPTVHFVLAGPSGTELEKKLSWEEGTAGVCLVVDIEGRRFRLHFKQLQTVDMGVTYESYVPEVVPIAPRGEGVVPATSGRHADVVIWKGLGDGWRCRARLEQPSSPKRVHSEGRTCGECINYDEKAGREALTRVTDQYINGGLAGLEHIVQAIADTHEAPPLTPTTVGECWRTKGLVAKTAPACEEHFHGRS